MEQDTHPQQLPLDFSTIPLGLCQCGCGLQTRISLVNHTRSGSVRGQHRRFRVGHSQRGCYVNTPESFWASLDRSGECWPFTGYRDENGYGVLRFQGKSVLAHRLAFTLANGVIDPDLYVLHSCDNPPCCRPKHLSQGTQLDNMIDAACKGRVAHGDGHWTRRNGVHTFPSRILG